MKILFRESLIDRFDLSELHKALPQHQIILIAKGDDAHLARELPDAEGVVGGNWTPALLQQARALRWVQVTTAGTELHPMAEFAARGIQVTGFRGVSAPNIGEHALALMLAFARGFPELMRRQAKREWFVPPQPRPKLFELQGQRVGIIGFGALGNAIAQRCAAMGMEVWVACRTPRDMPAMVARSFTMDRLEQMLGEIDHLVLSLPSTPATRNLIGAKQLAAMRKGSYIHNVGRGDCIDQDALIAALQSGHLGGAGLDVTEPEPLPATSPLWDMTNVIITGHTSGISPMRPVRGMEVISDNTVRFATGQPLRNVVTATE